MSKHRKNRKPQMLTAQPPAPANPVEPPSRPASPPAGRWPRSIPLQFAAIIGLSAVLGFTFNAANPIGVRIGTVSSPAPAPPATAGLTNFPLLTLKSPVTNRENIVSPPVGSPATVSPPAVSPPPVSPPVVPAPPQVPVVPKPPQTNPAAGAATPATTNPAPTVLTPIPIHWGEAKSLMATSHVVLVDVRAKAAYDAGFIPGAISLPEKSPPEEFAAFVKAHPTNTALIVYCASTSCSQSFRVAKRFLNEFHYASVKYMNGGYLEYQQEELAKSQPQPQTNQP